MPAASRPSPSVDRPAAGRDEEMAALDDLAAPRRSRARRRRAAGARSTRSIATPGPQLDAVAQQRALDHRGHLRILAGEERGAASSTVDLGAEAAIGLRELDADRPAADDEEALGAALGEVEDGLVREVGDLVEARDRRHGGARAGGERRSGAPRIVAPPATTCAAR